MYRTKVFRIIGLVLGLSAAISSGCGPANPCFNKATTNQCLECLADGGDACVDAVQELLQTCLVLAYSTSLEIQCYQNGTAGLNACAAEWASETNTLTCDAIDESTVIASN